MVFIPQSWSRNGVFFESKNFDFMPAVWKNRGTVVVEGNVGMVKGKRSGPVGMGWVASRSHNDQHIFSISSVAPHSRLPACSLYRRDWNRAVCRYTSVAKRRTR